MAMKNAKQATMSLVVEVKSSKLLDNTSTKSSSIFRKMF